MEEYWKRNERIATGEQGMKGKKYLERTPELIKDVTGSTGLEEPGKKW